MQERNNEQITLPGFLSVSDFPAKVFKEAGMAHGLTVLIKVGFSFVEEYLVQPKKTKAEPKFGYGKSKHSINPGGRNTIVIC